MLQTDRVTGPSGWWPLLAALLIAALLAIAATTPPAPRGLATPADHFSAERAMADVVEISRAPHPTGSVDNARVRAWLVGRLEGLGLAVRQTRAPLSPKGVTRLQKWSGTSAVPPIVNIVATLPGDPATPAVVLMAHYDSVWGSPAAADDGAGIASALEIVRAVKADPRRRSLIVVFTDGEELGLEGGRAFVAADPDRGRVGVIVNLETRGGGGRAAMFETGHDNGAMMRLFGTAVARPAATSLSVLIYERLPNSTDFTPAKARDVPGFNFAFIGRPALYHSPLATAANLDRGAVQDMGAQALDIVRALLVVPELPGKAPNLVFFDAFGWVLIRYQAAAGWLVIGAATLLFAVAGRKVRPAGDLLRGLGAVVGTIVLGGGLLTVVNLLSGASKSANYYDRLAAIPRLEVQALLIATATLASVLALVQSRQRGAPGLAIGIALPLLVLGVVFQIAAPTAAFIVTWPMLFAGLAVAAIVFAPRFGAPVAAVAAAVGTGFLLGLSFFLIEAVGPVTPGVAALPLALIAALLWPLVPPVPPRRAAIAGLIVLTVAVGIALWVRLDPMAATVPLYSLKV